MLSLIATASYLITPLFARVFFLDKEKKKKKENNAFTLRSKEKKKKRKEKQRKRSSSIRYSRFRAEDLRPIKPSPHSRIH